MNTTSTTNAAPVVRINIENAPPHLGQEEIGVIERGVEKFLRGSIEHGKLDLRKVFPELPRHMADEMRDAYHYYNMLEPFFDFIKKLAELQETIDAQYEIIGTYEAEIDELEEKVAALQREVRMAQTGTFNSFWAEKPKSLEERIAPLKKAIDQIGIQRGEVN